MRPDTIVSARPHSSNTRSRMSRRLINAFAFIAFAALLRSSTANAGVQGQLRWWGTVPVQLSKLESSLLSWAVVLICHPATATFTPPPCSARFLAGASQSPSDFLQLGDRWQLQTTSGVTITSTQLSSGYKSANFSYSNSPPLDAVVFTTLAKGGITKVYGSSVCCYVTSCLNRFLLTQVYTGSTSTGSALPPTTLLTLHCDHPFPRSIPARSFVNL